MSLLRNVNATSTDFAGRESFNSTFGPSIVATRQNNINVPFNFNNGNGGAVEYLRSTSFTSTGATFGQLNEDQKAYIYTGTGAGIAELISRNINRYIPGHGSEDFETMVFDSSETGVDSGVGYGTISGNDFIGFGYKGTVFGIWLKLRGVESHIPQSSWSDNTLLTGDFILDPQMENIQYKAFGWLGVADITFSINIGNDKWVLVHRYTTANVDNKPHMSAPSQPISSWVRRISGTGTNVRVGTSSWFAGTTGEKASGTGADKTPLVSRENIVVPGSTETVLLSVKNKLTFSGGQPNTTRIRYGTVTLVSNGTKRVNFRVYLNGVDGAVGTWGDYESTLSTSEINIDSPLVLTTRTPIPGVTLTDQQIGSTELAKTDTARLNLFSKDIIIAAYPGDIITITAESTNSQIITIQLRWIEEQ